MENEIAEEDGTALLVKALAVMLKPDEGIVIHHEGEGFVIYNNSAESTISIIGDDDYLDIEPGTLIWMHYDGSVAPDPSFDEIVIGSDEKIH